MSWVTCHVCDGEEGWWGKVEEEEGEEVWEECGECGGQGGWDE